MAASADDAMLSDMGHHHMGHFHGELSPKAFPAAAGFWSTYSAPGWIIMVLMSTLFIFIVQYILLHIYFCCPDRLSISLSYFFQSSCPTFYCANLNFKWIIHIYYFDFTFASVGIALKSKRNNNAWENNVFPKSAKERTAEVQYSSSATSKIVHVQYFLRTQHA